MATGADVRDILELGGPEGDGTSGTISKKDIINPDKVAGTFEGAEVGVKVLAKEWEGGVTGREMVEVIIKGELQWNKKYATLNVMEREDTGRWWGPREWETSKGRED